MTDPEFVALQTALAGEYSLQRELGRGGMGIVYLARDVMLDRDVAIKVLPAALSRADTRARFVREARTAAALSHPHIVPIHRVGEAGGLVYFVMTFVDGETLGERLRTRGPLPPADAARILREVAWALAYAHGRGVVHRDVKPDNILLEAATGRALVTDFGIAAVETDPRDTDAVPGRMMGTAHFMSPEQAAGEPADGRSDLYALGVVGHLAVSGRLPFEASSLPALLVRQATETPPTVRQAAPGLPAALAAAIDRCLARDPAERFVDGEALAAALVPPAETRPALPATLRAWLAARNPLLLPYIVWSGGLSVLAAGNVYANYIDNPGSTPWDVAMLAIFASLPIYPIIGFHLNQARRQFRAGHTLADLRTAIEVARRERLETDAVANQENESGLHRFLRYATTASATWLFVTAVLVIQGAINENRVGIAWMLTPIATTMLLGALSNALDVQFVPTRLREWWQTGLRDRLWNSRAGAWFAKRLGAPERSRSMDAGAFRATEAALGVAASELYAALPKAQREQLRELPATVAALEARAAEARAELDELGALTGARDASALAGRRERASHRLAESVAALETVRLDLLRLLADGSDLRPLTTLMDAAVRLGDDMARLADANREVESVVRATPRAGT